MDLDTLQIALLIAVSFLGWMTFLYILEKLGAQRRKQREAWRRDYDRRAL